MSNIDKIRQEIERLKGICAAQIKANPGQTFPFVMEMTGYDKLLSFLDTLSEEPDKSLEEEVKNYFQGYWPGTETAEQCNTDLHFTPLAILRLARHFANWQKEQFEKNRLADCDALTKEEYDRETAFAMEIIEKEHRQPTFTDAINYGMRLQKEQMMKGSVEGYVNYYEDSGGILMAEAQVGCPYHNGDKVRIIVLPKEVQK